MIRITHCLLFVVTLVSLTFFGVSGQQGAQCHTSIVLPRHFFNLTAYLGDWYMQKIAFGDAPSTIDPEFRCYTATFTQEVDPMQVKFTETLIDTSEGAPEEPISYVGIMHVVNPILPAIFNITNSNPEKANSESVVLGTDHDGWAIQYFCYIDETEYRQESLAIFNREKITDERQKKLMDNLSEGYGFPLSWQYMIDQENC